MPEAVIDNTNQWHCCAEARWNEGAPRISEPAPWVALYDGDTRIGTAQQFTGADGDQRIRFDVVDKPASQRLINGALDGFTLGGDPVWTGESITEKE